MVELYETIKALCEQRGVSVSRMCLDIGLSKSTMSDLKSGRKKTMTAPKLRQIADYLGVTVDRLLMSSDLRALSALDPALNETTKLLEKAPITNEQLKFALWGDTSNITDADLEDVLNFAAYIKQKREREGSK